MEQKDESIGHHERSLPLLLFVPIVALLSFHVQVGPLSFWARSALIPLAILLGRRYGINAVILIAIAAFPLAIGIKTDGVSVGALMETYVLALMACVVTASWPAFSERLHRGPVSVRAALAVLVVGCLLLPFEIMGQLAVSGNWSLAFRWSGNRCLYLLAGYLGYRAIPRIGVLVVLGFFLLGACALKLISEADLYDIFQPADFVGGVLWYFTGAAIRSFAGGDFVQGRKHSLWLVWVAALLYVATPIERHILSGFSIP